MTPGPPSTAAALLAAVRPLGPAVEGDELVFADDPPADLLPLFGVLHTGVRALLAGCRWCATTESGKAGRFTRVWVGPIDPAGPPPAGVTLLCVEGDRRWDRVHPAARLDLPDLFAPG